MNSKTKKKFTHAAKGVHSAEVANAAVRFVLCEIFENSKIKIEDMEEAGEFFDWKCPYTGEDLKEKIERGAGFSIDHIWGQNQNECGLNVKGNLVYVTAEANSKKNRKTAEEFLRDDTKFLVGVSVEEREARINKLKEFQEKNGYNAEWIKMMLHPRMQELYKEIQDIVEARAKEIKEILMKEQSR